MVVPRTTKRVKTLTPERWAQVEELFHRAAECDVEQRAALLDEACRNDIAYAAKWKNCFLPT